MRTDIYVYEHIKKARINAERSTLKNKHGCIIFDRNTVISVGHNKTIFFQSLRKYGYTRASLHAETDAILKLREPADKYSMLVIREGKTKLKNSLPCKACMAMIKEVGIKEVYYSTEEGNIEKIDSGDLGEYIIQKIGALEVQRTQERKATKRGRT